MTRVYVLIILFLLHFSLHAHAQVLTAEEKEREKAFREYAASVQGDTTGPKGWTQSLVSGVNLTQVSFKDWAAGGENALSYTVWVKGNATHDAEKSNWANSLTMAFGQTRLGGQGLRKTDDEIAFESLLIYKLGVHVNPYGSATLRTQFAPGFKYQDDGTRTQVSAIFDPAYLTQSLGIAYKPIPEVTTRFGGAVREIITSTFAGYADDPSTVEIENVRVRGGLESVTKVEWTFAENMQITSRLEMFAAFDAIDQVIMRSDNTLSAKVNKYVTVIFNVQLINEKEVTPRTQIKETLALGLSYTIL